MTVENLQFKGLENNGQKFISPHLRAGMTIYPLTPKSRLPYMPVRSSAAHKIDWQKDSTEASILSLSWDKQLGQPSGTWNAVLKQLPDRLDLDNQDISDGDWVDLALLRNGIRIPILRGVLDSARRRTVSDSGATVRTYNLSGRDHGAFFEYPITWQSVFAKSLSQLICGFATKKTNAKIGGRPDELFETLIRGWTQIDTSVGTAKSGVWRLPQSLSDLSGSGNATLSDILEIVRFNRAKGRTGLRGGYYNNLSLWSIGEQTLFQTLLEWGNPILNEIWVDLLLPPEFTPDHNLGGFIMPPSKGPARSKLVGSDKEFGSIAAIIRERPFPTTEAKRDSAWFSLPTWRIPLWLVDDSDFGRGGAQRYNVFDIRTDQGLGPMAEQQAISRPLWMEQDLEAHGLRVYQPSTKFFSEVAEGSNFGKWYDDRKDWLKLLADWFLGAPYLLQGTVTIRIPLPEIRIGQRVILYGPDPKKDTQFYVEGVSGTYSGPTGSSGASGSTTLVVTRGFVGSDEELMAAVTDVASLTRIRL